MPNYQLYNVSPTLPEPLEPLREMSFNVWWTWEPSARRLFRHLDPELWDRTNHNPVRMLQLSRQARLVEVSQDKTFLRELKEVYEAFRNYLSRQDTYGKTGAGNAIKKTVAYFSAEFGFHESIPNYSGGLGILAGDHCKSASDLDLNFVAIGLLYRHGYFKQQIDKDGVQQAVSLNQNFHHLPIREVRARRFEPAHLGTTPRPPGFRQDLATPGWSHQSLSTRHRHAGEQRRGSSDHRGTVRRRSRNAHPPGDRSRHRRSESAKRAQLRRGSVSHERRPLGFPRARTHSFAHRDEETRFLLRPSSCRGGECFHDPHAGSCGQRFVPARYDAPLLRELRDRARHSFR